MSSGKQREFVWPHVEELSNFGNKIVQLIILPMVTEGDQPEMSGKRVNKLRNVRQNMPTDNSNQKLILRWAAQGRAPVHTALHVALQVRERLARSRRSKASGFLHHSTSITALLCNAQVLE